MDMTRQVTKQTGPARLRGTQARLKRVHEALLISKLPGRQGFEELEGVG
jgi:hypothetical protein